MSEAQAVTLDIADTSVESFRVRGSEIERTLRLTSGAVARSVEQRVAHPAITTQPLVHQFDDAWLRRASPNPPTAEAVTIADLFSGCGGLSVGAAEAARAVGKRAVHVLALDNNEAALQVYSDNFHEADVHHGDIFELLDGQLGEAPTRCERKLGARLEGLTLAMGGPPCQGHSDLNNHTRRDDPKNQLYLRMIRFVEVVRPEHVLVENVPGVAHDRAGVVEVARRTLGQLGYQVSTAVINASAVGAAQARRRHLLLATRNVRPLAEVRGISDAFAAPPRAVLEVIGDIDVEPSRGAFGTPATHSQVNRARIAYLFKHDLHDLPDEQRPDCHRLRPHSYKAVYGRMYPDRPAPTITAGFGSTGQGRFVHPRLPRTLTPHEAARLQGFPDWFRFDVVQGRRALQAMIGNAVPSKLAYAAVASLLR